MNDLKPRNGRFFIISPNSANMGPNYVKMVEDKPILSATKM